MEGESRELSDAGVGRRRVGRDGAKRQGLAPGVRAGGDAVVDGGAEELLESVGGFEVERGGASEPARGRRQSTTTLPGDTIVVMSNAGFGSIQERRGRRAVPSCRCRREPRS